MAGKRTRSVAKTSLKLKQSGQSKGTLLDHFNRNGRAKSVGPNEGAAASINVPEEVEDHNAVSAVSVNPDDSSGVELTSTEGPWPLGLNNGQASRSSQDAKEVWSIFKKQTPLPASIHSEPIDLTSDEVITNETSTNSQQKLKPPGRERSRYTQRDNSVGSLDFSSQFTTRLSTPSLEGLSQEDPIIIDSSPTKAQPDPPVIQKPKPKAVFSIFERGNPQPSPAKVKHLQTEVVVPFPDCEAQHVRGPQTSYSSPTINLPSRRKDRDISNSDVVPEPEHTPPSVLQHLQQAILSVIPEPVIYDDLLPLDKVPYISSIPPADIESHPAITHVLEQRPNDGIDPTPSQQAWVEKWSPKRAEHVLGNEAHALYLRDWLRALEIQIEETGPSEGSPFNSQSESLKPKGKPQTDTKGEKRGAKRPRVIRAVEKRRGRKKRRIESDDEDDSGWIARSDESEEEPGITDDGYDDDIDFCQQNFSRLQHKHQDSLEADANVPAEDPSITNARSTPTFTQLSNTILLTGPSGCGKTSAVYACAHELDWEVFEVYPGIGKRGGASLENLVGEVGRTHLVRKTNNKDFGPKDAFARLLQHGRSNHEPKGSSHVVDDDGFGFIVRASVPPDDRIDPRSSEKPRVRQSMILLEEVDILFKEDVNFWNTVVDLIKDCKRPVIMTCNDIAMVPLNDLPLQTILRFDACPSSVATSYLQGLCIAENCLVDRNSLTQLYETTHELHSVDIPDTSLHPFTQAAPLPDLRRAVQCLQMHCCGIHTSQPITAPSTTWEDYADWTTAGNLGQESTNATESAMLLRRLDVHADGASFTDSFLLRGVMEAPETLAALYDYEASVDDEVGHSVLYGPHSDEELDEVSRRRHDMKETSLVYYDEDVAIATDSMRRSRALLVADARMKPSRDAFSTRALFRARVAYQSQMVEVLSRTIAVFAPLMPRPAVYLDYEPWIRHMVGIDDKLEREAGEPEVKRAGRMTRNSQKRVYVRQLTLTEGERETITKTRL